LLMAAPKDGQRLRLLALAGAVGVTGIAIACYVQRARARRDRKRQRKALSGPSLADEIKEALQREAEELQREPPDEELQMDFARATAWVGAAGGTLTTEAKLGLYGVYKQVTAGDAPEKKPWGGMEASMKYDAWNQLRGVSRIDAMSKYIELLDGLAPTWHMEDPDKIEVTSTKPDGSSGMGLAVSTMGMLGDPDEIADTDETPVGQLCAKIADGDVSGACDLLLKQPRLAFLQDKDGMAPLHWAADRGQMDVARVLIQMACEQPSADAKAICLNVRDGSGETPLHFAVNSENPELARLLVEAGADPSIQNEDGETPADLAEGDEMSSIFEG